jgi:cell division septation protein DedD
MVDEKGTPGGEEGRSQSDPESESPLTWLRGRHDADDSASFRPWMIAIALISVAVFAGVIWYAYKHGAGDGPPPVVTADKGPTRVKPEEPGGKKVDNADMLVYDRTEKPEQLLPPPEMPLDKAAPATPAAPTAPKPEAVAEAAPQPAPEPAPKPAPTPPAPTAAGESYLLQLGAFRSKEAALQGWRVLQKKHGVLLNLLNSDVQSVDLGDKGTFFRLRAGPFDSRAAALKRCAALKAQKGDCLVVKP